METLSDFQETDPQELAIAGSLELPNRTPQHVADKPRLILPVFDTVRS